MASDSPIDEEIARNWLTGEGFLMGSDSKPIGPNRATNHEMLESAI